MVVFIINSKEWCYNGKHMKIYVYLDESGSIHKNSKTRYFAVGGYYVFAEDKNKVTSRFKKQNLKAKLARGIELNKELKSYDYADSEKLEIINSIQDLDTFVGCVKIFDKHKMNKPIDNCNVFYNYAVGILVRDCIIPRLNESQITDVEFIMSLDNRNTSVGDLKDLQKYLNTQYCMKNFKFYVTYYDSATNFGVQLADLIVNTFYNKYKDISIVEGIIGDFKEKNFMVSSFPKRY